MRPKEGWPPSKSFNVRPSSRPGQRPRFVNPLKRGVLASRERWRRWGAVLFWLFFFIVIMAGEARANEWNWTPRLESYSSERMSNQRLLLKNNLNLEWRKTRLYVESYFEQNSSELFAQELRSPPRGYLQEAYVEFQWSDFFIKAGKQALRWSEMWATPSLDIFTGRRFNRGFMDPLTEQFSHSTGLLFSYTGRVFSFDAYSLWQGPETTYPEPFPEQEPIYRDTMEGGIRGKVDVFGHQFTAMTASLQHSSVYGGSWSYAFESFVPKVEIGERVWWYPDERVNQPTWIEFGSAGVDIFVDRWLITPQVTFSKDDLTERATQLYYGNLSWIGDRHEFSCQGSIYDPLLGQFVHLGYTYKPRNWVLVNLFWQNYAGAYDSLYGVLRDSIGTSVVGLRLQFDYDILAKD